MPFEKAKNKSEDKPKKEIQTYVDVKERQNCNDAISRREIDTAAQRLNDICNQITVRQPVVRT